MNNKLYNKETANLLKSKIKKNKLHWNWLGEDFNGAPLVTIDGTTHQALNLIWLIAFKEEVQAEEVVTVICNKEGCVNPDHLAKTTYKVVDAEEAEPTAIFIEDAVRDIEE